jgi:hypothetical protein
VRHLEFTDIVTARILAGIIFGEFMGQIAFALFHPLVIDAEIAVQAIVWRRMRALLFGLAIVLLAIRRTRLMRKECCSYA